MSAMNGHESGWVEFDLPVVPIAHRCRSVSCGQLDPTERSAWAVRDEVVKAIACLKCLAASVDLHSKR